MDIPIEMIAPSHGVIWRSSAEKIIQAYIDWSKGIAEDRVLIYLKGLRPLNMPYMTEGSNKLEKEIFFY